MHLIVTWVRSPRIIIHARGDSLQEFVKELIKATYVKNPTLKDLEYIRHAQVHSVSMKLKIFH